MEVPAGKSGAHAGRDKKQSNPTRKIFEIRINVSINWTMQASGDMRGWHKLRHLQQSLIFPHASCQPLVSPLAAIFPYFSLTAIPS